MDKQRVWQAAQAERTSSDAVRRALSYVERWPALSEARAVTFSLSRPDLSRQRRKLVYMPEALCEAVLDAGAPHLVCDLGWIRLFDATCNECGATRRRPRGAAGAVATVHRGSAAGTARHGEREGWVFVQASRGLEERPNAEGVTIVFSRSAATMGETEESS